MTLGFRILSDLHNEFSNFELPPLDTDKDDVLVLAGDIGVAEYMHTFDIIKQWALRFRKVIQIVGNHEYYHGSLLRARAKIKDHYIKNVMDVDFVDNEVVRVDNVSFICSTLWTNFNKGDPWAMNAIRSGLNDYNLIRTGNFGDPYKQKITPLDIIQLHHIAKDFIFKAIVQEKAAGQKTVVVTHHAPTTLSVHARYGNDVLNWAYVSDLSNEILDTEPDLLLHGHTHSSFDYMIGNSRVIANPRGYCYPNSTPENQDFNPTLRIEI